MLSVVCAFSGGTDYITKVAYFSIPDFRTVLSSANVTPTTEVQKAVMLVLLMLLNKYKCDVMSSGYDVHIKFP
jgi:hypothetical protein